MHWNLLVEKLCTGADITEILFFNIDCKFSIEKTLDMYILMFLLTSVRGGGLVLKFFRGHLLEKIQTEHFQEGGNFVF